MTEADRAGMTESERSGRDLSAIRFYERREFRIVERTDGASNEARRPDVRMTWRTPAKGEG